jgi:hypothetical protein
MPHGSAASGARQWLVHRDRGGLAISALPHHSADYAGRGAATEVKPSEPKKLLGRAMLSARLFASRKGTCGLPAVCAVRSRADAAASQLYKPCASPFPLFPDDGAQPPPEPRVKPSECSREWTRLGQDRIKRRAELARQTTSTEARNLASPKGANLRHPYDSFDYFACVAQQRRRSP